MIYFDNSATTKPYKEVVETYIKTASEYFGNPSSLHPLGKASERLLNQARELGATYLNVLPKEVYFTSGGTEGNNIAIKGTARLHKSRGRHLITTNIEHPSSLEAFQQLESEGFEVTYLEVDENGVITTNQVAAAIKSNTILVSIIHVNNEVGSILPINGIGQLLTNYPKILFHVDHVQGFGKVPLRFYEDKVDLCTISAHKFHGLKGNGILYIRDGVRVEPLMSGGKQERGNRPGTENVPGVVAMIKALRLSLQASKKNVESMEKMNRWIEKECFDLDGVVINSPTMRAPHILNMSVIGVKPEVVVQALAEKDIYVSTKSACSSKQSEPSKVLEAMGFDNDRSSTSIRLSFTYENTMEEAMLFVQAFSSTVETLKKVVEKK
ncbi:cysteine desulfurase family protein [Evansella sp. AB-P1]|uniref:cysteine desulfurase family protein n=1 Tax=Evansella sp. AB-P1 TaxID=3037653 RepID=UPI00241F4B17|nr:cysteine desulfurase family protein [Evansella sp. AB-P1]MDG5787012.1 cysteine desulfurase family protein [Evansella sp. AB-P1]